MKLEDKYTTSALMHLLAIRYGLNQLGCKQLFRLSTTEYHDLKRGKRQFNMSEALRVVEAFPELAGRFSYKGENNGIETGNARI